MVPIGGFYISKYYIFKSKPGVNSSIQFKFYLVENGEVYSALIAVIGANLILLAYILTAFSEDDEAALNASRKSVKEKKNQ